jgi:hypothetical protein
MAATSASNLASLRIAMTACQACRQQTRNPMFCSRSCAIRVHNRDRKRALAGRCVVCAASIPERRKYCSAHSPTRPIDRNRPIETFVNNARTRSRLNRLRTDAGRVFHAAHPYRCQNCGYDKFIEVCHKRSLTSFPLDTPISVVNSLDNLVGLCPNCHWEFDHGLLQL